MIPTQYNSLPGFRTVYSETELLQAIANSEVLSANNQAGGSDGDVFSIVTNLDILTKFLSLIRVTTVSGVIGDTADVVVVSPVIDGGELRISELTLQSREPNTVRVEIFVEGESIPFSEVVLREGAHMARNYAAGREIALPQNRSLVFRADNSTKFNYTVGYFEIVL